MAEEHNGLILITGATGTGKTTSMAAILNSINEQRDIHIIHRICASAQTRHLQPARDGRRFRYLSSGLRAALRQAPKLILVGEIRDRETIEIMLTAAGTGHLAFSSLHTIDTGQTINRILGMFETNEQPQIHNRLADTIRWIVSQRLLPKVGNGRWRPWRCAHQPAGARPHHQGRIRGQNLLQRG